MKAYGPGTVAAIVGLALAGCTSPQRKLTEGAEAALSWSATVHEVARQWTGRLVPTAFAKTALRAAQQSLEQERTTLAASTKDLADPKIAGAAALMGSMSAAVSRMAQAVEEGDGARLLRVEGELYDAEGRLKTLVPGSGS
jgi:hypothetical protein